MTTEQRIKLAADLVSGRLQLEPSLQQASELVRVPQAKIRDELKARAAACETERHLPVTALIEAWDRATEHEREAAVRSIGVAEVWEILARVVA
jgi:hypothetical protein